MLQNVINVAIIMFALWVVFETYLISVSRVDIYLPDIPSSFDRFRIVLISDIHGRRFTPGGQAVRKIKDAAPDIIAVTGDFVHKSSDELGRVSPFIESLCEIAPVYAVGGNHDYDADWSAISSGLKKAGATVLENEGVTISRGSGYAFLGGVHDPYSVRDSLARVLSQNKGRFVMLLAHAPVWFEPTYRKRFDSEKDYNAHRERLGELSLTLTGHTHGGQIRLPLVGAITTGRGKWFPKQYVHGLSREGAGWLYITRGLGQGWPVPVRFGARPEVAVLTLRKESASESVWNF